MGFWGRGHDHIGNFNFILEIEGLAVANFHEVTGMGTETDVIEYGGTVDQIVRKRPGRTKYYDITLKRGWGASNELWDWRYQTIDGDVQRRSGSIIICDTDGTEIERWNFFDAWPKKASGFSLDGKGNKSLLEEYTICVERLVKG